MAESGDRGNVFQLKYTGYVDEKGHKIWKFQSRNTGMQVVVAEVKGPLVCGHFCLATEALDDDGLPHTLEHLVFMGSKSYPYKGVLDVLANRCLASGANAWTETDHTCYTLTTAGSEGFLNLLPIYLDHILNPTLTVSIVLHRNHPRIVVAFVIAERSLLNGSASRERGRGGRRRGLLGDAG